LLDTSQEALDRGLKQISTQINTAAKKKKYSEAERDVFLSKLHPSLSYDKLKNSDVVIEAVFENMALKHKIIKQVRCYLKSLTRIDTSDRIRGSRALHYRVKYFGSTDQANCVR
jgi:3-hydroxyacyl-CoA dehydrogenase